LIEYLCVLRELHNRSSYTSNKIIGLKKTNKIVSRKELNKLDCGLESQIDVDRMLINKRGYYLYYNKPNRDSKHLLIHHHTCGECCYGIGKQPNTKPGRNGVWIGPSHSIEALQIIIQDMLGEETALCSCCQS
jgi:hypothetical protein